MRITCTWPNILLQKELYKKACFFFWMQELHVDKSESNTYMVLRWHTVLLLSILQYHSVYSLRTCKYIQEKFFGCKRYKGMVASLSLDDSYSSTTQKATRGLWMIHNWLSSLIEWYTWEEQGKLQDDILHPHVASTREIPFKGYLQTQWDHMFSKTKRLTRGATKIISFPTNRPTYVHTLLTWELKASNNTSLREHNHSRHYAVLLLL